MRNSKNTESREYPRKELILDLLKAGAILTAAFIAPGAVKLFVKDPNYRKWKDFHRPLLVRNIKNLQRKGLVQMSETKEGTVVRITEKGKTETLRYDVDKIKIDRPDHWDGKWRFIMFDIGNDKKEIRELFREKLKQLEFYPFQESVFIFPFPCIKEIKYLREVFEIPDEVKIVEASQVENDEDLRTMYRLH